MRRCFFAVLCLFLLLVPAQAAQVPKYAVLTFDDGPSGRFTRKLLDGLDERGVSANFLLCGYRIEQDPALAEDIFSRGHEIGLHGYSHKTMQGMSRRDIASELERTRALLPQKCTPAFIRPPGGCCSDAVHQVAEARGEAILLWSVDPRDWNLHDSDRITRQVIDAVQDGDIILLHDMTDSSVNAALHIVDALQEKGFTFVTASQLARIRGVRIHPGTVYRRFPPEG